MEAGGNSWRRLGRLMLKELRGILRDRRTIITLVLMPLLLYPLLSIGFQQFFLSNLRKAEEPRYRIGYRSDAEGRWISSFLERGGLELTAPGGIEKVPSTSSGKNDPSPAVTAYISANLETAVREGGIDVGIRLLGNPRELDLRRNLAVDCELVYDADSYQSRAAAAYLEEFFTVANGKFLAARLRALGARQRSVPVRPIRKKIDGSEPTAVGGVVSIAAVIPFILILMTITGAVYPAIDLTAGERERGTLEILVAAPIPRIGLLFAKYVAVLTVALLTAAANLFAMMLTLHASGVGRLLFGEEGISAGTISAVLALLLLFAAFFSAVLLVLTSFARSFREAQAYLIPLMLVSLGPGILSLTPGLELKGILLVTPLANITLLGRDLFELKATGTAAATVVVSTMLYAFAAIAIAARIFGGESVLYGSEYGWSDLLSRPKDPQPAPTITNALFCLAVVFSAYFLLNSELALLGGETMGVRLSFAALATALVFGILPTVAAYIGGVPFRRAFQVQPARWPAFLAALLLGISLWTFAHEIVVIERTLGLVTFDAAFLEKARQMIEKLQAAPLGVTLLTLALVPAMFEELFFRGYLFGALQAGANKRTAVFGSALLFGLFHFIVTDSLAFERLIPSTLLGLVLGWIRWRTDSLFPGIVLHACHNGFLLSVAHYQTRLAAHGWGIGEEQHLPATWLASATLCAAAGAFLIHICHRPERPM